MICIEQLKKHQALIPLIAHWLHREWGAISPYHARANEIVRLQHHANSEAGPFTLVAFWRSLPVGCVSMVFHDSFEQPWLTNLYVEPLYRGRGVGTALVRRCQSEATFNAVEKLLLVTINHTAFFARLGWSILSRQHFGSTLTIMEKSLAPHFPTQFSEQMQLSIDHHPQPK